MLQWRVQTFRIGPLHAVTSGYIEFDLTHVLNYPFAITNTSRYRILHQISGRSRYLLKLYYILIECFLDEYIAHIIVYFCYLCFSF